MTLDAALKELDTTAEAIAERVAQHQTPRRRAAMINIARDDSGLT